MLRSKPSRPSITALLLVALVNAAPLSAQDQATCTRAAGSDGPARQVFTCGDALSFEREPSASLRIFERPDSPAPRTIEVQGGAILIDVTPGSPPTQIRTPQAIATVRGTTYIVDAQENQSSVFVIEGSVTVSRRDNARSVTLHPGEGVDVALGSPLVVRSWSETRAADLLARFGR